jgi:hypothetical protein
MTTIGPILSTQVLLKKLRNHSKRILLKTTLTPPNFMMKYLIANLSQQLKKTYLPKIGIFLNAPPTT